VPTCAFTWRPDWLDWPYELAQWLPEQRVEFSMLLESAGIAYNWEGTDLTVAEEHERQVDSLFQQVHGVVEEGDEARYHAIEELFGSVASPTTLGTRSAKRLSSRPSVPSSSPPLSG
jgi:hypothetical protein